MRKILKVWNCQEHRQQLRELGVWIDSSKENSGGSYVAYKEPLRFNQADCVYCLLEQAKDLATELHNTVRNLCTKGSAP